LRLLFRIYDSIKFRTKFPGIPNRNSLEFPTEIQGRVNPGNSRRPCRRHTARPK